MSRRSRRSMLIETAAVVLALPAAASALASRRGPGALPSAIGDLLPDKARRALRLIEQVIALESEAGSRGLPDTLLSLGMIARGLPEGDRLYLKTMPHLVALIDRGELGRDLPFADRAGKLLAELHREQWSGGARVAESAQEDGWRLASLVQVETSTATAFAALRSEYVRLFETVRLRPQFADEARWHLTLLRESRPRYEAVSRRTGVPWWVVGAVHGLEASFNFRGHLHNGDFPLNARTRNVPAGRPKVWLPPVAWEESAVDALRHTGFAGEEDWSLPRSLHRIEAYNGFGYRRRGVPTPYLWSFGDHYDRGKFVADGRWDPRARSEQCGAAMMLKLLSEANEVRLDA